MMFDKHANLDIALEKLSVFQRVAGNKNTPSGVAKAAKALEV
ncbi:hypothetical protein V7147_02725 [Bacillus sp. JJ1521]